MNDLLPYYEVAILPKRLSKRRRQEWERMLYHPQAEDAASAIQAALNQYNAGHPNQQLAPDECWYQVVRFPVKVRRPIPINEDDAKLLVWIMRH